MMAVTGTLQLPHELGICMNDKQKKQFKGVMGSGRLQLLRLALSSHASFQCSDALSLQVSDSINQPIRSVHTRYNVFICRSFLIPGPVNEVPVLKTAATALTRSYNALHGRPLVLQLVPALGIIVFAMWGLGPLVRHSRNLFLHRSDSNWKKSSAHYVLTSYVQPLLLWTGATLVCRALDPVVLPSEASQAVKQRLLSFVRSLSAVLACAYSLSSLIQQAQKFFMETNDSNDTKSMGFQFAGKAVYSAVWVAAVSLFMELLGFSTQKWLTAGGLGTVLLTLAGREIFTNFLSSIMIHATRPFVLNEWIQTKIEGYEVSGTVEHVGWWSPTIIRGDDREAVHIPNHKFTVNVVRNLSQKTHWRIKTHLAVSHLDVNKINIIVADMRKVLAKNPQVEQQRLHRRVFLDNIDPDNQSLLILVSCFVKTPHIEEYLCVKEAILLDLLRVISHHRARLATPIRTVQKIYSEADIENIPYSETIFTRAGAATKRPFLLIEPPYKINGDDKTKAQARSIHTNEVQDAKLTTSLTSDSNVDGKVEETQSDTEEPKADAKVAAISSSEFVQNNADNQAKKVRSAEARQNSKVDSALPVATSTSTPSSKSALEDNIVLGVALEGSKRTLPIEDEMDASQSPAETKELAACHSGNGSSSSGKDKKDGQIPVAPVDQRDYQER